MERCAYAHCNAILAGKPDADVYIAEDGRVFCSEFCEQDEAERRRDDEAA
jgi:hypothetical protein